MDTTKFVVIPAREALERVRQGESISAVVEIDPELMTVKEFADMCVVRECDDADIVIEEPHEIPTFRAGDPDAKIEVPQRRAFIKNRE